MSLQDKKGKFPVKSAALVVGVSALIFALPALGQQGPESLAPGINKMTRGLSDETVAALDGNGELLLDCGQTREQPGFEFGV